MKTISITLFNRLNYTKQLFDALDKCNHIDEYSIFIFCEPTDRSVIELAKKYRTNQSKLLINKSKLGCSKNIYQAIDHCFSINNDFHIHFEDDTIPGKDCLCFFEWAKNEYRYNYDIANITAYYNHKLYNIKDNPKSNEVYRDKWFTPWVWGTWKYQWDNYKLALSSLINNDPGTSWDIHFQNTKKDKYQIFPLVSRSQNIGAEMGTHVPSPEWHRSNQYLEHWIESDKNYCHSFMEFKNG